MNWVWQFLESIVLLQEFVVSKTHTILLSIPFSLPVFRLFGKTGSKMILIMTVWLPKTVQFLGSRTTDHGFLRTSTNWNLHYDTNFASALELVILYGWMVHTSLGSTMMLWCFAIPSCQTYCLVKELRQMTDSLENILLISSALLDLQIPKKHKPCKLVRVWGKKQ